MRLNLSKLAVIAVACSALVPVTAMAMPVSGNEGPGGHNAALVCGKDYSRNSVSGNYCARSAPASIPAQTPAPASPQTTTVVVKHHGFSWGDAFAGAGAALVVVLTGLGAFTARQRRRGSTHGPLRGPAVTG
jgi:hypothetical protein